jgi:oligosaccharide translocation protein RFT1
MASPRNVQSSLATSAVHLVGLQFVSRILTFVLNQWLLRFITPSVLGVANVQLDMLWSILLFLAREPFRCALLRTNLFNAFDSTTEDQNVVASSTSTARRRKPDDDNGNTRRLHSLRRRKHADTTQNSKNDDDTQIKSPLSPDMEQISRVAESTPTRRLFSHYRHLVNLAYIPLLLGLCLVTISLCLYRHWDVHQQHDRALVIYILSALIELAIEPLYIIAQNLMYLSARIKIEGLGVFVRCFVIVGYTYRAYTLHGVVSDTEGVLAFAFGLLAYAMTLSLGYIAFFDRQIRENQRHVQRQPARRFWYRVERVETLPSGTVGDKRAIILQSWFDVLPQWVSGERFVIYW